MKTKDKTLSESIKKYEAKGYNKNFELTEKYLHCLDNDRKYDPKEFSIVEVKRFDGMTDAGDDTVIYVVEADDGKTKGLIVDGYGVYSDSLSFEMINKLKMARGEEIDN